ncbi:hypothetical protein D9758_015359 [Tetrapyrgos nigripes]|uniref:WD40 repeat-like protein n=1 Tax=Tetrapyrgos nigripes TaxID=182062 RepID=A0A8H5CL61_9AGAR|nr:hypothetical protein D9758_015359 [Tetrapyrgos nigripes]
MPSQLIWQPTSSITLRPDQYSDGISAMAFSVDGRFLAVASGRRTEIWDTASDTPYLVGLTPEGSDIILCINWLRTRSTLISGHENGDIFMIGRVHCVQSFRNEPVVALSLFEDKFLAVLTASNVQLWDVDLRGRTVPPFLPCDLGELIGSSRPQSIHWLGAQRLVISYPGTILVEWKVHFAPLSLAPSFRLGAHHSVDGVLADISPDNVVLVADLARNRYMMISLNSPSALAVVLHRPRRMPSITAASRAGFASKYIVEESDGNIYLWDPSCHRYQAIVTANPPVTALACTSVNSSSKVAFTGANGEVEIWRNRHVGIASSLWVMGTWCIQMFMYILALVTVTAWWASN